MSSSTTGTLFQPPSINPIYRKTIFTTMVLKFFNLAVQRPTSVLGLMKIYSLPLPNKNAVYQLTVEEIQELQTLSKNCTKENVYVNYKRPEFGKIISRLHDTQKEKDNSETVEYNNRVPDYGLELLFYRFQNATDYDVLEILFLYLVHAAQIEFNRLDNYALLEPSLKLIPIPQISPEGLTQIAGQISPTKYIEIQNRLFTFTPPQNWMNLINTTNTAALFQQLYLEIHAVHYHTKSLPSAGDFSDSQVITFVFLMLSQISPIYQYILQNNLQGLPKLFERVQRIFSEPEEEVEHSVKSYPLLVKVLFYRLVFALRDMGAKQSPEKSKIESSSSAVDTTTKPMQKSYKKKGSSVSEVQNGKKARTVE